MAHHHTDPLAGFGFIEAPELTWREKADQIVIGVGFAALVIMAVFVIAPAFLALTRMI
jgi:hypothetical protein